MKEIMEMTQTLLGMGTDTYTKCKCMVLAVSRKEPKMKAFFEILFERTDRKRPLLIGMKEGGLE